jgi:hypothetical protein
MKNRVTIEEAENGFTLTIVGDDEQEESKDDFGYSEPTVYVATSLDEALEVIKKNFTTKVK